MRSFCRLAFVAMACGGGVAMAGAPTYELSWHTIDTGGLVRATASGIELSGSTGQPDAGRLTGGAFELSGGFWVGGLGGAAALPGDCNCDGSANVLDINPFVLALSDPAAYAVQYPSCDIDTADANGDGAIDVLDINPFVALLSGT